MAYDRIAETAPALALRRRLLRARVERRRARQIMRDDGRLGRLAGAGQQAALALAGRVLALCARANDVQGQIAKASGTYGPDPRHRLDVYFSRNAERAPVIVFFYGGAWRAGAKADFEFVGRALARLGFVVVIGDQRLAPGVRFPAFLHDGAALIAWTQRSAAQFGGDPTRLLLLGHSAGAYNAVMLALDQRYLVEAGGDPSRIAGVIALSGPYDFYPFPLQICVDAFGAPADPASTQPVSFARPDAPPLLIATGERDTLVPHENSIAMVEAMAAAGGRCAYLGYRAAAHLEPLLGLAGLDCGRAPTQRALLCFAHRLGLSPTLLPAAAVPHWFSPAMQASGRQP